MTLNLKSIEIEWLKQMVERELNDGLKELKHLQEAGRPQIELLIVSQRIEELQSLKVKLEEEIHHE